jgi:hypothetical protein
MNQTRLLFRLAANSSVNWVSLGQVIFAPSRNDLLEFVGNFLDCLNGPLHACYKSLRQAGIIGHRLSIIDYHQHMFVSQRVARRS